MLLNSKSVTVSTARRSYRAAFKPCSAPAAPRTSVSNNSRRNRVVVQANPFEDAINSLTVRMSTP